MARRFRRPCSLPATKSNPAKLFSLCASFPTTSLLQLLPAPRPSLNRQPPSLGKSRLQLPLPFVRPSLPCPLPLPRQTALTKCRIRLNSRLPPKYDPSQAWSRQLQDRQRLPPYRQYALASHPRSPSAVGLFTRFPTAGKSRKVLAFNKMQKTPSPATSAPWKSPSARASLSPSTSKRKPRCSANTSANPKSTPPFPQPSPAQSRPWPSKSATAPRTASLSITIASTPAADPPSASLPSPPWKRISPPSALSTTLSFPPSPSPARTNPHLPTVALRTLPKSSSRKIEPNYRWKVIERGKLTLTGLPPDLGIVAFQFFEASFAFLRKSFSAVPSLSTFTLPFASTVTTNRRVYGSFAA